MVQDGAVHQDSERCERAVRSRDTRFDGVFYLGVTSTGIYCRPSCPARTPSPANMRFYPSAAAAQQAGFRACKRCRPDATPGSAAWDGRADVVARSMRLIAEGVVDREGVGGLARRVGYSTRQLERQLNAALGAGPLALARAQRAQTARVLVETTELPMASLAFAAGFASIRSFNETVQQVFGLTPGELRRTAMRRRTAPAHVPGVITLRLAFRHPLCPDNLFGHLAATAVPGVEEWRDGAYRRTLRLVQGHATVALRPRSAYIECVLALTELADLAVAISRCRRLLDLDADPEAVDTVLGADPVLAPFVHAAPGRRVPRTADPGEFALRAVLGQQVSTVAARTHAGRLVERFGDPVSDPAGGLTHLFPPAGAVAAADPTTLALPARRSTALLALAAALDSGSIDLGAGCDWDRARAGLAGLPGIGHWTLETIAMRALGDPDAFPSGDLGVVAGARRLGLGPGAALAAHAARWRPWRSYAVQHLWASGEHPINSMPGR